MSLMGIASQCGIMTSTLEDLINGHVGMGVGSQLGVMSSSLQTFVDGGTSMGLAGQMGTMSSNVQELRNRIGREGAIGLLIGMMAAKKAG